MGTEIDRLEIQVGAQAQKANSQLETLITKLDSVASSLMRIDGSGLTGMANGAQKIGALTNQDLSSVMSSLQSGLIGQSRALYKFGIDITNNTLQQYAYAEGIDKSVSAMTQAEKMQLRLLAILDQSKVAWGDQANTLGSVVNQYRIMQQQDENLARTIVSLFLPVMKVTLPYVNALLIMTQRLLQTFGFKLWGDSWLKDLQDGISGSVIDDSGLEELEEDFDGVADAAKKAKGSVRAFDELNVITTQDKGSASTGGIGGIDLSGSISDALAAYEKTWEEAYKFDEAEGLGTEMGSMLTDAMNGIPWESIYEKASGFGVGLAQFLNGLISPELFGATGKTIAGALNTALYAVFSFSEEFEWYDFGEALREGINEFLNTYDFETAGFTVGNLVSGIGTSIYALISDMDIWKNFGSKLSEGINGFFTSMNEIDPATGLTGWETWAENLNLLIDGVSSAIGKALSELDAEVIFSGIGDFLKSLEPDTIATFIGLLAIKLFGKNIGHAISNKVGTVHAKIAGISLIISSVFTTLTGTGTLGETLLSAIEAGAGTFALTKNPLLATLAAIISLVVNAAVAGGNWLGKKTLESIINANGGDGSIAWELEDISLTEAIPLMFDIIPHILMHDETAKAAEEKWKPLIDNWLQSLNLEWVIPIADIAFFGDWDAAGEVLRGGFEVALSPLKVALDTALAPLKTAFMFFGIEWEGVAEDVKDKNKLMPEDTSQKWSSISKVVTETVELIEANTSGKFVSLSSSISEAWGIADKETTDKWISMKTTATGESENIKSNIESTFNGISLISAGINAMQGFLDGIISKESSIMSKATSIAAGVAETIAKGLDIHSPSRVMFSLGNYTMEGFKHGMENLYEPIKDSLKIFGGQVEAVISPSYESMYSYGEMLPITPDISTCVTNSYMDDNAETNALLRELISSVNKGQTIQIDGKPIFQAVRAQANEYFGRTQSSPFPS